jgi:16S rRNA (uracil1498-N3)-methyltransferase
MPLFKHLFTEAPLQGGMLVHLPSPLQHRLSKVLRLGEGNEIALFNGKDGLWQARVADKACKTAQLGTQLKSQPAPAALTLVLGLPKRDAWESALRQATELGVGAIQPLQTEYAQRGHFNAERAHTLVVEAAEQSEHLALPTLLPTLSLPAWLKAQNTPCLYGAARGEGMGKAGTQTVLVGPEGGFSPAEEALLAAHPYITAIHLPMGILRTDTAVVALLTAAMLGSA